ncbi:MAG: tetratricopeptide repeat protein [Bryobacteraceae bacterium]|nr:tetratricopeptide repeat protein [Bryobacteraceae bacterium]
MARPAVCGQSRDSFESLAQRASEARENDRLDEAIALYRKALALKPEWPEGLWHLGTLEYDEDRLSPARDLFESFVALEPKAGQGWAMLGLCEARLKHYPVALKALEHGRRLGLGPNRDFVRVVNFQTALLFNRQGFPDAAAKLLEGIAALVEGGGGVGGKKGLVLADKPLVDAIGLVALRYPLMPDEVPASKAALIHQAGLAQARLAVREYADAEPAFRELVAAYPNERGVHYMYGCLLLHGDSPEAAEEFKKELAIRPEDADSMVQLAFLYLRHGDYKQGIIYAEKAVTLVPGNFAAHMVFGSILLELEEFARALPELEKAVKLAPNSVDAHFALARGYAQSGREADARREQDEFQRLRALRDQLPAK